MIKFILRKIYLCMQSISDMVQRKRNMQKMMRTFLKIRGYKKCAVHKYNEGSFYESI